MKIDHLVVNIDKKYQTDKNEIDKIRNVGLSYEPTWGKGTNGFKVSNIWIGKEYFELVNIKKNAGGGWLKKWTDMYNSGHRGLVCLMIDVENIDDIYTKLVKKDILISKPIWLEFKWFFNLFTRRMPWKNAYIPFFEKVPFQIGFQQMKDEKSKKFMEGYMIPNSKDNGITGIEKIRIGGKFTDNDFKLLSKIFENTNLIHDEMYIKLDQNKDIIFKKDESFFVEVFTSSNNSNKINIENISIYC